MPVVLLVTGVVSVAYWHMTDDLRPYFIVQFYPLLTIPVMLALFDPVYSHGHHLLWSLGWYLLAKVTETLDKQIFSWTRGRPWWCDGGGGCGGGIITHGLSDAAALCLVVSAQA